MKKHYNFFPKNWKKKIFLFCFLFIPFLSNCWNPPPSNSVGSKPFSVIYGDDDRKYTSQHNDTTLQQLGKSVAVVVSSSSVIVDASTKELSFKADILNTKIKNSSDYGQGKYELCTSEPFREDLAPGSCTGFLVGPNLLATAGHCISKTENMTADSAQYWCNFRRFLFGFEKGKTYKESDLYSCKKVLTHRYSTSPLLDIALIELDRNVQGIQPLAYDITPNLQKEDAIAIIGFPHGTWQKIATGAKVLDPRTTQLDYFKTDLDSMPGNSGSPVFSMSTYKVIGIHVRGERPVYDINEDQQCLVSHKAKEGDNQSENYMNTLAQDTCQNDTECGNERVCDKGKCYFRTADLLITQLTPSKTKGALDETIEVSYTIQNQGNYDTKNGFRISLWRSTNENICVDCGKDTLLNYENVPALKAGASYSSKITFQVSQIFSLQQYVGLYVDDFSGSQNTLKYYGDIAETNEQNNEKSFEFLTLECPSSCTENQKTCLNNQVVQCTKEQGCLVQKVIQTCETNQPCNAGACQKDCQDSCSKEDTFQCNQNQIQLCTKNAKGCLEWQTQQTCPNTQRCYQQKCTEKKKEGEDCVDSNECSIGTCTLFNGKNLCLKTCQESSECTNQGFSLCRGSLCLSDKDQTCTQNADCADKWTCVNSVCVSQENNLNQGCSGCNVSPSQPNRPIEWIFLCLFLFFLKRKLNTSSSSQ